MSRRFARGGNSAAGSARRRCLLLHGPCLDASAASPLVPVDEYANAHLHRGGGMPLRETGRHQTVGTCMCSRRDACRLRISHGAMRMRHRPIRHCEPTGFRSEEHTSELQSLMRSSYAVFCLKKKNIANVRNPITNDQIK